MARISRRKLLAAGALGAAGVALELGTRSGGHALAGVPPSGGTTTTGVTTLDATVQLGPVVRDGYRRLIAGPGEPHIVRRDLLNIAEPPVTRPLIAFAQMSDLHIVDDRSPLRVEFLDKLDDPGEPHFSSYGTGSAYRPQESMSVHLTDAMCRALAKVDVGPATGLPLCLTLVTGDAVDNCQLNETRWYIDLLDGRPVSQHSGAGPVANPDQSVTGSGLGLNLHYWHPEHLAEEVDEHDRVDKFFRAGFPPLPGMLAAARREFHAYGLRMPWYTAYGNHDRNVQGNVSTDTYWVGESVRQIATGGSKPIGTGATLPDRKEDASWFDWVNVVNQLQWTAVEPDADRRLLSRLHFIDQHFITTGLPVGHGFTNAVDRAYYAIPSKPDELFQFICLDTTKSNSADGYVDDTQMSWLSGQLMANSSRYLSTSGVIQHQPGTRDKLIVIFCHHTIGSIDNGAQLRSLLLRFPNVILMVDGHTHTNNITAHGRGSGAAIPGGFWEVNTASHIDWPIQSRIIEVAEGNGVLNIFTTMVDIDAPLNANGDLSTPEALASLARELAANDIQGHNRAPEETDRRGEANDRNTRLLLPAPFTLPVREPRLAAARAADGRINLFGLNTSGLVFVRHQNTPGGIWSGWNQHDGYAVTSMALERNADGRMELLCTNVNGNAYRKWQLTAGGSWTRWQPILNTVLTSVALARNADGRLQAFGCNTQPGAGAEQLWTRWQTSASASTWSDWTPIQGSLRTVAAESNHDGRLVLFGINHLGWIMHRWQNTPGSAAMSEWTQIPGRLSSIAVARNGAGALELFGTDQQGVLYRSMQTTPGASTWTPLAPFDALIPGFIRSVTAESNADGRIDVIVLNSEGELYLRYQLAAGGPWSNWVSHGPWMYPISYPVPDLRGLTSAGAAQALTHIPGHFGTSVGYVVDQSCNDIGLVVSQYPLPGSTLSPGSTINITVAKKPPPPFVCK